VLALFLGCLVVQLAWILAVPPFRGTDEFDHAYRAAEVAGGEWLPPRMAAENGRGDLIAVPRSIVEAAHPICASYTYTGPDNCSPVRRLQDGRVLVASGASAYNPLYYWIVGSVARLFDGYASLYAMRVASALICATLIALAGWATTLWARSSWPLFGLLLAITPVMAFSVAVVAPNGPEMCAALGLWSSLMGLGQEDVRKHHSKALILMVLATLDATILTTLRSIGPLWVALIVLTLAIRIGPRAVTDLARRRSPAFAICTVVVGGATLASAWWTRASDAARLVPDPEVVDHPWLETLAQVPWWVFQGIAAFPRRNIPAPSVVYVLVFFVLIAVLCAGFAAASRNLRATISICLALSFVAPVVLTVLTIEATGPIWQGRYGLPYHLGVSLLACQALDRRPGRRLDSFWIVVALMALGSAHVASILHVFSQERISSPLAGSPAWAHPNVWWIGLTASLGCCLWALVVLPRLTWTTRSQRELAPVE
jgi:hypothetical protein